jgi:hypothetical protein
MAPNDPLFDTPAEPSDPAPDPKSNGSGDPAPQGGLSTEQVSQLFSQGIQEVVGPLSERVDELAGAITKLSSAQPAPVHTPEPTPELDQDFLTEFSQNPEGAIKKAISSEMKGLVPFLNTIIEGGSSAFVGVEAERVDREFGPGAWDKFFQKPMDEIIGMYRAKNPAALGDRGLIRREVDGITGRLVGKLVEHKEETKLAQERGDLEKLGTIKEDILKDAANRISLTGGIRRMNTGEPEVTEELRGYLKEREDSIGLEQDPKDFLRQTDYGNTLEDYETHQEKLTGGNK